MVVPRGLRQLPRQWRGLGGSGAPSASRSQRLGSQLASGASGRRHWHSQTATALPAACALSSSRKTEDVRSRRTFHTSLPRRTVKPVVLADIGEGIVECEIIQWFVEPGARVEEFSPLCEVQSDKASVEITSRFAGVVKKLYYEAGDMAKVGKPFVDIDILGDTNKASLVAPTPTEPEAPKDQQTAAVPPVTDSAVDAPAGPATTQPSEKAKQNGALATPAVRHLSKEFKVDITQIDGTGKDGRVLKEDIYRYVDKNGQRAATAPSAKLGSTAGNSDGGVQTETPVKLTKNQEHMFKTMTRSLAIPHFLYADEIDFTNLCELRDRLNKVLSATSMRPMVDDSGGNSTVSKLSYLPFIIKAMSMALYEYPILNARVEMAPPTGPAEDSSDKSPRPSIVLRSQHNVGVAMDTPAGLLVPVIRDVGARNVLSIAAELQRLQRLALAGQLAPRDLGGGTITVSNIGTVGGTYLSPVIVEREVAILGVGRLRTVPAFDAEDRVVKRQVCNFSWSADHRVVDGATMARAAEVVRRIVEEPDVMVMHLR